MLLVVPFVLVALSASSASPRSAPRCARPPRAPTAAGMLGIPVRRLQSVLWAIVGVLAYVTLFLRNGVIGASVTQALDPSVLLAAPRRGCHRTHGTPADDGVSPRSGSAIVSRGRVLSLGQRRRPSCRDHADHRGRAARAARRARQPAARAPRSPPGSRRARSGRSRPSCGATPGRRGAGRVIVALVAIVALRAAVPAREPRARRSRRWASTR